MQYNAGNIHETEPCASEQVSKCAMSLCAVDRRCPLCQRSRFVASRSSFVTRCSDSSSLVATREYSTQIKQEINIL